MYAAFGLAVPVSEKRRAFARGGSALGFADPASSEAAMPDPLALSARDAAREIAAGRLSAVALVEASFDRIAAREPVVGAWHHLDRDAALAAARRRDASAPKGPLHGIPIAVKDLID